MVRFADTVVIGAGQAGLALSHELRAAGHEHVVLERGRVGERWRSERWESLTLLTPNWLNALPGAEPLPDADGYLDRLGFIAHLEAYAEAAPVHEGTTVVGVRRVRDGHLVSTDDGEWHARSVAIATGDSDLPRVPGFGRAAPAFAHQLHSSAYRRPEQLPAGGVLVVGAGPSGQQIAAELRRAGRDVVLAAGRHARMPRHYRGRDAFWWLRALGQLDVRAERVRDLAAARRAPSFPVSGRGAGESLGLDRLAGMGVLVCGRLAGFAGRHAIFAGDLELHVRSADERLFRGLASIDRHIERSGEPAGPADPPPPLYMPPGPETLDLRRGIRTIVWATGFRRAYPWLRLPVLDAAGELAHRGGVTSAPGLFALGLRFQRTRKSHLIGGVGEDAAAIARAITRDERLALAA